MEMSGQALLSCRKMCIAFKYVFTETKKLMDNEIGTNAEFLSSPTRTFVQFLVLCIW